MKGRFAMKETETMTDSEVRAKLQIEFDEVFATSRNNLQFFPHVVVFLSAPQDVTRSPGDPAYEMSAENIARAMYSVILIETQGSDVSTLILSGETEQLPGMKKLVEDIGERRYIPICSGNRGQSHTGTQFESFVRWLRQQSYENRVGVVLVTSQYHVPRVRRYAAKHIPCGDFRWHVAGVPNDVGLYNQTVKVDGEIDRIVRYANQGIFDLFPDLGEDN